MSKCFLPIPANSPFPLRNLPYGIFSTAGRTQHAGVAIGDFVLDLTTLEKLQILSSSYFAGPCSLNFFIEQGKAAWQATRRALTDLLSAGSELAQNQELQKKVLVERNAVCLHLPVTIGDYTDFYSSKEHATNVGSMFRDPENALLPNWKHLPVAYHGRASSIVVSGTDIRRPCGQTKADDKELPSFGPSRLLDFELEVGCIVGKANQYGEPIPVDKAHEHIFGFVLVNDWSARDIQKWEYVPLGPFLAKNFATSISPWIVTLEALLPHRVSGPAQDPQPLPYLQCSDPWSFDIELEVTLATNACNEPTVIARSNYKHMYWNICQQIAHHSSNGCPLRVGDLLASGTISGPTPDSYGSLLELSWRGTKPLKLENGTSRTFLQDGDCLTLTGISRSSDSCVGFGEVSGSILPAKIDDNLIVNR